ncbi:cysteine proteinase inhibitor 1-like [Rosa sericea]
MRPFFCLLAILAVLLPLAAAARGGLAGGWRPIKDINDPHVKEIAEFAVSEYNKKSGKKLEFQSVVKGETQVVAGENYRLVIAVKDNSAAAKYEGVVYEKIWEHTRELLSFDQVKK